jgi:hypothetical protein
VPIEVPIGENSFCLSLDAYQDGQTLEEINAQRFNGGIAEVDVKQLILPAKPGTSKELTVEVTKTAGVAATEHEAELLGSLGAPDMPYFDDWPAGTPGNKLESKTKISGAALRTVAGGNPYKIAVQPGNWKLFPKGYYVKIHTALFDLTPAPVVAGDPPKNEPYIWVADPNCVAPQLGIFRSCDCDHAPTWTWGPTGWTQAAATKTWVSIPQPTYKPKADNLLANTVPYEIIDPTDYWPPGTKVCKTWIETGKTDRGGLKFRVHVAWAKKRAPSASFPNIIATMAGDPKDNYYDDTDCGIVLVHGKVGGGLIVPVPGAPPAGSPFTNNRNTGRGLEDVDAIWELPDPVDNAAYQAYRSNRRNMDKWDDFTYVRVPISAPEAWNEDGALKNKSYRDWRIEQLPIHQTCTKWFEFGAEGQPIDLKVVVFYSDLWLNEPNVAAMMTRWDVSWTGVDTDLIEVAVVKGSKPGKVNNGACRSDKPAGFTWNDHFIYDIGGKNPADPLAKAVAGTILKDGWEGTNGTLAKDAGWVPGLIWDIRQFFPDSRRERAGSTPASAAKHRGYFWYPDGTGIEIKERLP